MTDAERGAPAGVPGSVSGSFGTSVAATLGRQVLFAGFSLLLARLLGPEEFGVTAQAIVYITLATLILDQGLTQALVTTTTLTKAMVSASVGLNAAMGVVLAVFSVLLADPISRFFHTPALADVVSVMGCGLMIKGAMIVPRMLLLRNLRVGAIALGELGGAFIGGIGGLVAALGGLGYWAVVVQYVLADIVALAVMATLSRPPLPSLNMRPLRGVMGFGMRVFGSSLLGFLARNADDILVGRVLGPGALAMYSISYRLILAPVQLVGMGVGRVLVSAIAHRPSMEQRQTLVLRCLSGISFVAVPAMLLVSASSSDLVHLILGPAWVEAIPVLAISCLTGARQALTAVNAPILTGFERGDILLKFTFIASVVQVSGIVIGLNWGIVGVASGYAIAGLMLTPYLMHVQGRLTGLSLITQTMTVGPFVLCAVAASFPYLSLYMLDMNHLTRLSLGSLVYCLSYLLLLRIFCRSRLRAALADARSLVRRA